MLTGETSVRSTLTMLPLRTLEPCLRVGWEAGERDLVGWRKRGRRRRRISGIESKAFVRCCRCRSDESTSRARTRRAQRGGSSLRFPSCRSPRPRSEARPEVCNQSERSVAPETSLVWKSNEGDERDDAGVPGVPGLGAGFEGGRGGTRTGSVCPDRNSVSEGIDGQSTLIPGWKITESAPRLRLYDAGWA